MIHDDKDRRETTWLSNLFGAAGGLWDLVGEPPKVCRLGEWERSCGEYMDLMPGALGAGGGVRTSAPSGSLCVCEPAPREACASNCLWAERSNALGPKQK